MKSCIAVFALLLVAAFAPSEAQVACGGQATLSTVTVSSTTPLATAVTATVAFTTVGNLASGDKVTLNFPSGYFTGTPTSTLTGFAGTIGPTAQTSVVMTTNAAVTAGAFTVTIAGLVLGGPMLSTSLCSGFTLNTGTAAGAMIDTASSSVTAPALGGTMTITAFTPQSLVPATASQNVVIAFKTATALAVGNTLVLTYPSGFLATGVQPTTPVAAATGSFAFSVGTTGATSVTVTVATNPVAIGSYTITLAAVTMGPGPLAAGANDCRGIGLSSTTDAIGYFASPALGGSMTLTSITSSSVIPTETAQTLIVVFKTATALAVGNTLVLTYPNGFLATGVQPTTPVAAATGSFAFSVGTTGATSVTVTVATNPVAIGSYTITLVALTMGPAPLAGVSNGITLASTTDAAASANAPALGGQVTLTSVTPSSTTPLLGSSSLVVVFTTATKILNTGTLTLNYPSGYVSGASPTITKVSTGFAASIAAAGQTSVVMTTTAAVNAGSYTVTIEGLTLGGIMTAPCQYFSVSTTSDLRSVNAITGGAMGKTAAVTGFTTSTAVPLTASASVTVTFTTATNIASGGTVVLTYPSFYITGTSSGITASTGFAASIGACTENSVAMTTTAAVTAGTFTVTIAGVTMGGPTAAVPAGIAISTTTDSVGTRFTAPQLGGVSTVSSFVPSSRVPLTATSSVVVSFTTATNIASGGLVTLYYPDLYITGTPTTPVAASTGFAASIAVLGTGSVVLTTTAAVTAGSFTITIAAVTMGGPMQSSQSNACGSGAVGVSISTPTDRAGAVFTPPNLGGLVSVTSFSPSTRTPLATSSSLTIAFTTQTNIASGGFVTLFLPSGFATGSPTSPVTASTGFAASIAALSTGEGFTLGVMTTTAAVTAGSFTVTIAGVTMGGPMQLGTTVNVGMMTSTDGNGANVASGSLGGVVSSPMVTIATADRMASVANRKVVISFGIATNLASGDTISVVYPSGLIASGVTGTVNGITSSLAINSLGATTSTSITLTTSAAVTAGSFSVTICGLTVGAGVAAQISSSGIKISTSKDSPFCVANVAIPTMGQVSLVGLSIPWASRVSGTSGVSPVLTFTTATTVPASACTANAVTVTITTTGTAFFSQTASACNVLTALSATGFATVTIAQPSATITTLTLSTNAALAAGLYTVTLGGLTFGSSAGLDTGLGVATSMDAVGTGATGPLSGYRVDKVTVSSGCVSGSCGNVQVQFTSNVAIASPLVISFSSGALIDADSPAFMLGGALATPNVNVGTGAVTLTLTGMSTVPAGQYTVTLVGKIQAKAAGTVSVGSSTASYSQSYVGTSTSVTTSSLSITGALPNNQAASGSIMFTTNSPVPKNGMIYITYKTGFFVVPPAVFSSTGCTSTQGNIATSFTSSVACVTFSANAPVADSPSAGLTTITLTNTGVSLPSGVNTVSFSGGKLGAAQSSTSTFSVTTSAEICSAGSIASGSISNSNPGGSAASAGASLLLSAAAALTCALLLLL